MRYLFLFLSENKRRATILAVVWTLLILVACLIPGREVPDVAIPMLDKWVHFVIFGGFSFLWLCVLVRTTAWKGGGIGLLSVILGYLVELLQGSGITSGRSFDVFDILADAIGGVIGVLLFFLMKGYVGKVSASK